MKKLLLNIIQYAVFIGLSGLLLYLAVRNMDFSVMVNRLIHAKFGYIALSLLLGFIAVFIRAYRWKIMIEPAGYTAKTSDTYHAVMIGYMANYAFPRIGEVTRCGVLSRTSNIPAETLIGTVIAERIFDVLVLLLLTILVILLNISLFGGFFFDKIFNPIGSKIYSLFTISYAMSAFIFISLIATAFIVYAFRNKILKITIVRKAGKLGKGIVSGAQLFFKIRRKKAFVLHTLLMWGIYWLMSYTFLLSLEPTSQLTLIDALFIMVAGSYGMAAPVQAGIGAYHAIIGISLGVYAISWNDALSYAFLSHGAQAIGIIVFGIVSATLLFIRKRKQKIKEREAC